MRTGKSIVEDVARETGFTVGDLTGKSRKRDVVLARQEAMLVIFSECPHLSLSQVGQVLGGRDHTTVIHGVAMAAERKGIEYDRLRAIVGRPDKSQGPRPASGMLAFRSARLANEYIRGLATDYGFVMWGALDHA